MNDMEKTTAYPVHKALQFTNEQWAQIRAYRFAQQINTDAEAVRVLLDLGLKTTNEGH